MRFGGCAAGAAGSPDPHDAVQEHGVEAAVHGHRVPGPEPTEFRFQGRPRAEGAVWVLFVAALFLLGSLVTGAWGIAALFHASWLDSGDLPAAGPTAWGIGMLLLATVQGICGLSSCSAAGSDISSPSASPCSGSSGISR